MKIESYQFPRNTEPPTEQSGHKVVAIVYAGNLKSSVYYAKNIPFAENGRVRFEAIGISPRTPPTFIDLPSETTDWLEMPRS